MQLSVTKNKKVAVMSGVILAMLLAALDQTIVSTAMPEIVRELNGLSHLSWVFTAYMLASTITVPVYGKLSDIYGRRGFYLIGIAVFLLGSILSGVAQSMTQLIIFRAIQGIGGGAMMVNSIAIIGDLFPPAERGKWQGVIGGVFGLASVAGPLLGGWLTDNASWRWAFYVNIPLGIAALSVIAATLPKIAPDVKRRIVDYAGAAFLSTGLVSLLLALVWGGSEYAWQSPVIIALLAGAAVLLSTFVFIERKAQEPILPLSLFRNKTFVVSILATFLSAAGMFGAIIYIPLYAQGVIGVSATNSGLILMPLMFGLIAASIVTGQIMSRTGRYKWLAVTGMGIITIGMFLFSRMGIDTTNGELIRNMVIAGIGLGTTFPIFNLVVQNAFDHSKLGVVTAANQLFRSIGGTVGTAVLASLLNNRLQAQLGNLSGEPFVQALQQFRPELAATATDLNSLQGLLQPAGREQILGLIAQAPAAMADTLMGAFNGFLVVLRGAYNGAITDVFFAGAILMAVAFVVVWFLPFVPLRKSHQSKLVEAGMELEAELGQADEEHEPDLAPDEAQAPQERIK